MNSRVGLADAASCAYMELEDAVPTAECCQYLAVYSSSCCYQCSINRYTKYMYIRASRAHDLMHLPSAHVVVERATKYGTWQSFV